MAHWKVSRRYFEENTREWEKIRGKLERYDDGPKGMLYGNIFALSLYYLSAISSFKMEKKWIMID